MSSNWDYNLLEKLDTDGPIRMYISEKEYSDLCGHIRNCWDGVRSWRTNDRRLLLAFFRGYTFYRELSENEDQFWANFCSELGLEPKPPTLKQYDEVWDAFGCHPEVAILRIKDRRREFVKTIDAVWGIESLRAKQLELMFLRYYQDYAEEPITGELIKKLVDGDKQSVIRQAASYDRVFRSLVYVVDYIISHNISLELLSPDYLIDNIEQSGFSLGHPNPIRFLYHKSSHVLPSIIATLRNEPRRREKRQQKVQQKMTGGRLSARSVRKDVRVSDIQVKLPSSLQESPPVQVIATRHKGILIEGQVYAGEVRFQDGRFQTFRWRAQWGELVHCQVIFEEGERISFSLEANCLALRLNNQETRESIPTLSSLDSSALNVVLYNPYRREWLIRYSLASEPSVSVCVSSLGELRPYSRDRLLVEVCIDGRSDLWQPLAHATVQVKPEFESCEVKGNKILLTTRGPRETLVYITERVANSNSTIEHVLEPEYGVPMEVILTHPAVFQPVIADVALVADIYSETRSMVAPPRLSLEKALQHGIGWSKNHPV